MKWTLWKPYHTHDKQIPYHLNVFSGSKALLPRIHFFMPSKLNTLKDFRPQITNEWQMLYHVNEFSGSKALLLRMDLFMPSDINTLKDFSHIWQANALLDHLFSEYIEFLSCMDFHVQIKLFHWNPSHTYSSQIVSPAMCFDTTQTAFYLNQARITINKPFTQL